MIDLRAAMRAFKRQWMEGDARVTCTPQASKDALEVTGMTASEIASSVGLVHVEPPPEPDDDSLFIATRVADLDRNGRRLLAHEKPCAACGETVGISRGNPTNMTTVCITCLLAIDVDAS